MAADVGMRGRPPTMPVPDSSVRANYTQSDLAGGVAAVLEGIKAWHIWGLLAWGEIRSRYRRSFLGPLWMTLASGLTVLGLGALWSRLWGLDLAVYYPYVAAGLITWNYLASVIVESTTVFVSSKSLIHNTTTPLFAFPMRSAMKQLLFFLHQAPVIAIVFVAVGPIKATAPLALVGVALIYVNSIWIAALIGMLGARFRDLSFIVEAAVPLLLFLTPVLWRPQELGDSHLVVILNPLAHALAVVRDPLFGHPADISSYIFMTAAAVVGWALTIVSFRYRQRIPFWV